MIPFCILLTFILFFINILKLSFMISSFLVCILFKLLLVFTFYSSFMPYLYFNSVLMKLFKKNPKPTLLTFAFDKAKNLL